MSVSMIDGHEDAVKQGDLISRSALLEEHCDGCPAKFTGTCSPNDPVCGLAQLIYEAPAVDAVQCLKVVEQYVNDTGAKILVHHAWDGTETFEFWRDEE